ncbi:DUF5344 family protein [Shouchella lonarensis]|uniref:Uncharacterized protein n=1 Tax=Shouchella lonarensis TaxID=1464122 RepID=A0A1G6GY31_9BACI|nr:DUF5344 family protein [Shouchella lonarensis]SDB86970.1 hypothetical protein SAMN05421737_102155 [Shouchella lonarensis]
MEIKVNVPEALEILKAVGSLADSFEKESVESNEELEMLSAETGEMEDILDKLSRYFQALSQMEQEFQTLVQEYEQLDKELAGKMA